MKRYLSLVPNGARRGRALVRLPRNRGPIGAMSLVAVGLWLSAGGESLAQAVSVMPLPPQAYALRPNPVEEKAEVDPWSIQLAALTDPPYVRPKLLMSFGPRLKEVWLEALERPDHDAQRLAADCLSKSLRLGLEAPEAAAPLARLVKESPQRAVVVAAARTLVTLDARQHAELLWEKSQQSGLDLVSIVEPALARWDFEPARQAWLQRLSLPWRDVDATRRRLAIELLGQLQEAEALDKLVGIVETRDAPLSLRHAAARALAGMHALGGRETPGVLLERADDASLLCAAEMLLRRDDQQAKEWLLEIAKGSSNVPATIAHQRLLDLDPDCTFPLIETALGSSDARRRQLALQSLEHAATPEAIDALAWRLADSHPSVRRRARDALLLLGQQEALRQTVLQAATRQLEADDWKGIEQACKIVAAMDHQAAIPRLVDLQKHSEARAYVNAAWALKVLRPSTEVLDRLLPVAELAHAEFAGLREKDIAAFAQRNSQFCQLAELFGHQKYEPAAPLLLRLVPKMTPPTEWSRAVSVWALGHIYEGRAVENEELVAQMIGRYTDIAGSPAEMDSVRRACAGAFGRMQAHQAIDALRKITVADSVNSPVGQAGFWALQQLTGEPMPSPIDYEQNYTNWFLEPFVLETTE